MTNPAIFLSVVIPAYNEENSIERVLLEHLEAVRKLDSHLENWEIVCLDDASGDRTLQIVQALAQRIPQLRILRHAQNQGIYASYAELFREARGTHIYQTASDGQWPAENLLKMFQHLKTHSCDLVIGVRRNRREIYNPWRYLLSAGFNFLPRFFFKVITRDANSIKLGCRAIFNLNVISRSFFAEIERIIEAQKKGYRVGFVPINFLPRSEGQAQGARWRNISATIRDFFRYALRELRS